MVDIEESKDHLGKEEMTSDFLKPKAEVVTVLAGIWVSNEWLADRAARKNFFPGGNIRTTVLSHGCMRLSLEDYNSFKTDEDPTFTSSGEQQ